MLASWPSTDRRAAALGVAVLVLVTIVYPPVADAAGRPLAAFVLPCLLTAVLGGWRPAALISCASIAVAVVMGLAGPLTVGPLLARWSVIAIGAATGVVGAAVRERQAARLRELDAAITVRETFERALVPVPVPPPGVDAIARFRPAETRMRFGGDFVEAVGLPDGRLAVLVGDVCGHGPREAAFGAALRAGWKGIALTEPPDPVGWIESLDAAFFRDGRIDTYATLCTGYVDPASRTCRLLNAGHPKPILIGPQVRELDLPPGPPLGIGVSHAWSATETPWEGEPTLFYTDGLIENPRHEGRAERWDVDGLLRWIAEHSSATDIGELADELMRAATAERDIRDDVATLIVAASR